MEHDQYCCVLPLILKVLLKKLFDDPQHAPSASQLMEGLQLSTAFAFLHALHELLKVESGGPHVSGIIPFEYTVPPVVAALAVATKAKVATTNTANATPKIFISYTTLRNENCYEQTLSASMHCSPLRLPLSYMINIII